MSRKERILRDSVNRLVNGLLTKNRRIISRELKSLTK